MSKFNSTISVVGIDNPKVQQALLKLLENSIHQKELVSKTSDTLSEQIRRVRQQLASVDFDIDDARAQQIADKISEEIGDSVRVAAASATAAAASAASASSDASDCHEDAQAVQTALENMESTIAQYAQQAAETAAGAAITQATTAAATATTAAQTATEKATAATTSANNAATTAAQAAQAATEATQAVQGITFKNLSGPTTFNATNAQYRKVATLPAVSTDANAVITFWGAMGGWTNATLRQIGVTIGNRQTYDSTYSALDIEAYFYRASMPTMADIVIYKESNNTFSVYLKGAANAYFRHEIAMTFNEYVTAVSDTFRTATPTGTLVWSFLSNAKRIPTADELANYAAANHTHSNYALSTHNHSGVYQPAGSYAAADHNHSGVYQPAGSYAAANHSHSEYAASNHSHSGYAASNHTHSEYAASSHTHSGYAASTVERFGLALVSVDLQGRTFPMSSIVNDTYGYYNVKVTFVNNSTTARSCKVNSTTVSLSGSGTASTQISLYGTDSFTVDNIATTVSVFIRIWR